jgi:hypothetical protein
MGQNVTRGMDSKVIQPKAFDYKKHPLPKDTGQSAKTAAAGKVVDPTGIETAQGADNVTVDTVSAGMGDIPTLEAG